MMLELHREAKSHFIFSTVSVLQQKFEKWAKYGQLMLGTND